MLSVSRFPLRWFSGTQRASGRHESTEERRFARLVDAHLDSIYRMALFLGVQDSDVEDLVQEVLMVLARRLSDIELDKERAFALRTTARLSANFRRSRLRRREQLLDELDPDRDCGGPLAANGEQCVEHAEALALLSEGLAAMTEAQRVIFILFELEELRASEIAAELGIAEAAVVSRLHRARRVMRRVCERARRAGRRPGSAADEERLP